MELIHAETYEEAWQEVQRLKESAAGGDPVQVFRIIDSPYRGYDIVMVDSELYSDMLSDQLVDGFPSIPALSRKRFLGGYMK